MNRFGWPLVPSALALWATNFSDRFFLVKLSSVQEVGRYSLAVRIASAMVLLLTAFRTAWPAFAYSIEDDEEARGTYGYVLTYLLFVCSWIALALSLLAPWIVRVLAPTNRDFWPAARVVPELAFAAVAFAGYIVMAIGVGRARRTQFNWVVTGVAAALNVALNLILIPRYGMLGAAIATVAAYALMFAGMTLNAQRVPRAVPVAAGRDPRRGRSRADAAREGARRLPHRRARARCRVSARPAAARLLPAGRTDAVAPAPRPFARLNDFSLKGCERPQAPRTPLDATYRGRGSTIPARSSVAITYCPPWRVRPSFSASRGALTNGFPINASAASTT